MNDCFKQLTVYTENYNIYIHVYITYSYLICNVNFILGGGAVTFNWCLLTIIHMKYLYTCIWVEIQVLR